MAGEYVPGSGGPDCSDYPTWGRPSPSYYYIFKGNAKEEDYPEDACTPWYHQTAQIDSLKVNSDIFGTATAINVPAATITCTHVTASGTVTASTSFVGPTINALQAGIDAAQATASSKKGFDISHPTKDNTRLRYICVEGPTADVFVRGRLTGKNVIELPEHWRGLVDPETITVTLTQIGSSQDLIVDAIQWGKRIKVRSGTAANIDCYFLVHAERKDGERLIVEYEGTSIDDYPGDNSQYTHNK